MSVKIALDDITRNNLAIFNKITAPNTHPEQYIQDCLESGELCQYAYFSEVPVGLIASKPLQPVNSKSPIGLIIDEMAVLKAYSSKFGIEDKLIDYVEKLAEKRHLNKVFVLLQSDDKYSEFYENSGYAREDVNEELYKGLGLTGGVLLKKQIA